MSLRGARPSSGRGRPFLRERAVPGARRREFGRSSHRAPLPESADGEGEEAVDGRRDPEPARFALDRAVDRVDLRLDTPANVLQHRREVLRRCLRHSSGGRSRLTLSQRNPRRPRDGRDLARGLLEQLDRRRSAKDFAVRDAENGRERKEWGRRGHLFPQELPGIRNRRDLEARAAQDLRRLFRPAARREPDAVSSSRPCASGSDQRRTDLRGARDDALLPERGRERLPRFRARSAGSPPRRPARAPRAGPRRRAPWPRTSRRRRRARPRRPKPGRPSRRTRETSAAPSDSSTAPFEARAESASGHVPRTVTGSTRAEPRREKRSERSRAGDDHHAPRPRTRPPESLVARSASRRAHSASAMEYACSAAGKRRSRTSETYAPSAVRASSAMFA